MMLPYVGYVPMEILLLAGRAVFLVISFIVAAIAFTRWSRVSRRQGEELLAQTHTILQRTADLEARIDGARQLIEQLAERLERSPSATATPGSAPGYQIAIRLARGGASREELIASCGLSAAEAELVQRLHAGTPRATARAALAATA